jgi:hypothetical protein
MLLHCCNVVSDRSVVAPRTVVFGERTPETPQLLISAPPSRGVAVRAPCTPTGRVSYEALADVIIANKPRRGILSIRVLLWPRSTRACHQQLGTLRVKFFSSREMDAENGRLHENEPDRRLGRRPLSRTRIAQDINLRMEPSEIHENYSNWLGMFTKLWETGRRRWHCIH